MPLSISVITLALEPVRRRVDRGAFFTRSINGWNNKHNRFWSSDMDWPTSMAREADNTGRWLDLNFEYGRLDQCFYTVFHQTLGFRGDHLRTPRNSSYFLQNIQENYNKCRLLSCFVYSNILKTLFYTFLYKKYCLVFRDLKHFKRHGFRQLQSAVSDQWCRGVFELVGWKTILTTYDLNTKTGFMLSFYFW